MFKSTSALLLLLALSAFMSPAYSATIQSRLYLPRESHTPLETAVLSALHRDPLTKDWHVQVDTYGGLVVLHGWVLTRNMRDALEAKVNAIPGVEQVYDYVNHDDLNDVARSIEQGYNLEVNSSNIDIPARELDTDVLQVTQSGIQFDKVPLVVHPLPPLAVKTRDQLNLDPVASAYENLRVDSWNGLVILHGRVEDRAAAQSIERLAARTPGVQAVFSYLTTDMADVCLPREPVTGEVVPYVVHLEHEPAVLHEKEPIYTSQPSEPERRDFR